MRIEPEAIEALGVATQNMTWLASVGDDYDATHTTVSVRWDGGLEVWHNAAWDATDAQKRTDTLGWLARWAARLARRGKVTKEFTVYSVFLNVGEGSNLIQFGAGNEYVCEIVPKLDECGAPVMEAKVTPTVTGKVEMVPVTEKVCPPSLLQAAAEVALAEVAES